MSDPTRPDEDKEQEYPFGMNRRQAMKYLGGGLAAGAGVFTAGCSGGSGGGPSGDDSTSNSGEDNTSSLANPLNSDRFADTRDLSWICDASSGPHFRIWEEKLNEEAGLSFTDGVLYEQGNTNERIQSAFTQQGKVPWDLVQVSPIYIGSYGVRDVLEPLDDYIAKYDRTKSWDDGILDPFREFYTKWDGKTLGIPIDGDLLELHYRPSYFEDEEHQRRYREQTGQELRVPKTWKEFNQVAQYFEENAEGVHGTMLYGNRPFTFGYFMSRAASNGVLYFDEDMNPDINSDSAIEALQDMVECVDYSPAGTEQFGIPETINQWQQGNVVMCQWWLDLPEFTARGDYPVVGDQASAKLPGYETESGDIRHRACMASGRLWGIPKDKNQDIKEAAFYAAMRESHQDLSIYGIADPYLGNDPYMDQHYTEKAAKQFTKPNPLRPDSGPGFDSNPAVWDNLENAKQHLEAAQANMSIGFPQPYWPGARSYIEPLALNVQRALAGQKSPTKALNDTADEWEKTLDRLGRDQQTKYYQDFLNSAEKLGYL
ncbi:extracellular solute-binding protein [Halobacterium sp. KA-4]|uniref:extracellular solute-binding protein n=1 Tax=Halobacterium sp. KA-4 TaxID=2896367 RepID=UPI001E377E17|nr:extracellular solute-binding protein [Halobacterium sp. KA-4]MCD2201462.1 extracellular solute-binding protein [Halobacterium sp. KA-4]